MDEFAEYERKSSPSNDEDEFSQYARKPSPKTKQESPKQNPLVGALEKIGRYGVIDPAIGIGKLGESVINSPHYLEEFIRGGPAKIFGTYDSGVGKAMGIPEEKRNLADKIIQGTPEFAATLLAPEAKLGALGRGIEQIPQAGKYLKTALGNALTQGGIAAGTKQDDQRKAALEAAGITAPFSALAKGASEGSPLTRLLSRGLMSAGGAGAGYAGGQASGLGVLPSLGAALAGGIGGYKLVSPDVKTRVAHDVFKGVEGTDYKPVLEAAERLNLTHLTPAEASNSPIAGATQGGLGKTEKGYLAYSQGGKERAASEKGAINNFLDTVFKPGDLSAKKNELYEVAKPQTVSDQKIAPLYNNEVFKEALNTVQKNSAYKESLKGVPENSIEYLDHVKQAMDDMIQGAPKKEGRLIKKTQKKLMGVMDDEAPEYQQARALAEREITRGKVEDFFDKRKLTGTNFGKFLNSEKNYKILQNNLRNVPEAQQQLADMKLVFGDNRLINLPGGKGAEAQARTSMSKSRSSTQDWKEMLREIISGGKYDKTAVDLIRNPQWANELGKMKSASSNEKLTGSLIDLFGKAGAQDMNQ